MKINLCKKFKNLSGTYSDGAMLKDMLSEKIATVVVKGASAQEINNYYSLAKKIFALEGETEITEEELKICKDVIKNASLPIFIAAQLLEELESVEEEQEETENM